MTHLARRAHLEGMRLRSHLALLVSLVLAAGSAAACKNTGEATGATCPTGGTTLTYDNFGKAFMATYCNDCHSGHDSPSLDTVALIRANASDIDRTSAAGPNATNTVMPEDGSVPSAERTKLGEWLACGAP